MNSRSGMQVKARSAQAMLCPCCGGRILLGSIHCVCGGRFTGAPLDETPIKVKRLGPAITSVALLVLIAVAGVVGTKWLAFAGVLVIWSAWRAMRLAEDNPEWYGGYKTAAFTLAVAFAGTATLAAYGVARVPRALDNFQTSRIAATQAAMYHYWAVLEAYKSASHSYPKTAQDVKKLTGEPLPSDYWDRTISYQASNGAIADRSPQSTLFTLDNFELRSAGPDGLNGTDDDIVMRNGVFFTSSELKNQSVVQQLR